MFKSDIQNNMLSTECDVKLLTSLNSDVDSSLTFSDLQNHYLRLDGWKNILQGQLTFWLRTISLNGLIMYSTSISEEHLLLNQQNTFLQHLNPVLKHQGFDFFALELRNGLLHFVFNTGSGVIQPNKIQTNKFISDGQKHFINIKIDKGNLQIILDKQKLFNYQSKDNG